MCPLNKLLLRAYCELEWREHSGNKTLFLLSSRLASCCQHCFFNIHTLVFVLCVCLCVKAFLHHGFASSLKVRVLSYVFIFCLHWSAEPDLRSEEKQSYWLLWVRPPHRGNQFMCGLRRVPVPGSLRVENVPCHLLIITIKWWLWISSLKTYKGTQP